jgi:hypothetical protein
MPFFASAQGSILSTPVCAVSDVETKCSAAHISSLFLGKLTFWHYPSISVAWLAAGESLGRLRVE